MIDRNDDLPVSRQAKVLGMSRADDLALMRRIDELHLDYPFAGSRMLQTFLVREGYDVGRLHVATLMKRMGIEAIYRRPNTSKPAPRHTIFPYLLRKLPVTRPNQVWAMDITYFPMARGSSILRPSSTGSAGRFWHGSYRLHWKRSSVWRRSRRLLPDMASRRSSTPIRAPSSPASPSPACCSRMRSRSAWMGKAPGETTSSSSACGRR